MWSYLQGAVYVESTTPIPVEELTDKNKSSILGSLSKSNDEKDEENIEEGFNFEEFYEFVTENGLQLINEE